MPSADSDRRALPPLLEHLRGKSKNNAEAAIGRPHLREANPFT
jgi:hypothetical protein